MADTTRQVFLASRPTSRATLSDFGLREVPLPSPADGELLLKGCFLSLDPYMRGMMDDRESYAKPVNVGDVMPGEAVCVIESSRHHTYRAGDVVLAQSGWQTKCVCGASSLRKVDTQIAPMSAYLGVLGMPGFTAYAGMRAIGKPGKGETVVVTAAAGAVGSLVGQAQFWKTFRWRSRTLVFPLCCSPANSTGSTRLNNRREVVARIPNARLAIIKGSGHLIPIDEPLQLANAIRRFITELAL